MPRRKREPGRKAAVSSDGRARLHRARSDQQRTEEDAQKFLRRAEAFPPRRGQDAEDAQAMESREPFSPVF